MLKRFSFFLSLAALCGSLAFAQPPIITISVPRTPPNNGKQMYASYCANCHGMDGRGHGATAASLQTPPADLTVLSRDNHGVYPARHVEAVLQHGVETPGHGSKIMPVWGPVLDNLDRLNSPNNDIAALRINNLMRYVETLQTK
jgi:mono/diheme cytochrome c family protein